MYLNPVVLTGTVTHDPEFRHTAAGVALATFTVVFRHRVLRQNKWVGSNPIYKSVVVWRDQARNVAHSLAAGTRVTVIGREVDDSSTPDGSDRRVVRTVVEAEDVAVSLRYAVADITKIARSVQHPQPGTPA